MMKVDNELLKKLIRENKYKESADILKEKIIEYIVDIIKQTEKEYEYTNIIDLIAFSEQFIEDERRDIARNLEYFSFEEDDILRLDRMLTICEKYNIK